MGNSEQRKDAESRSERWRTGLVGIRKRQDGEEKTQGRWSKAEKGNREREVEAG